MTVVRLRPAIPWGDLAGLLPAPHDHMLYGRGHGERVDATIALARAHVTGKVLADLSCGNAAIAKALDFPRTILGDFAPGYPIRGPIEDTIDAVADLGVDVFVLSETIEHLDDPAGVLSRIREAAGQLVLSTPLEAWNDPEDQHYWAWDRDGVEGLLTATGWTVAAFDSVDSREYGEAYLYGIWVAA